MSFVTNAASPASSILLRPTTASQSFQQQDRTAGRKVMKVGRFRANFELTPIQVSILKRVAPFWTDGNVNHMLRPITTQKGRTSLRVLDWLCTNWSKSNVVVCEDTTIEDTKRPSNIHQAYRNMLTYYKRRNFDPFRRRLRIVVEHPDGNVESTVGQLNYLVFCHTHGILKFANENVERIEKDMNATLSKSRKRKQEAKQRGSPLNRTELTPSSSTKVIIHSDTMRVKI